MSLLPLWLAMPLLAKLIAPDNRGRVLYSLAAGGHAVSAQAYCEGARFVRDSGFIESCMGSGDHSLCRLLPWRVISARSSAGVLRAWERIAHAGDGELTNGCVFRGRAGMAWANHFENHSSYSVVGTCPPISSSE